ncbi:MAG: type II toxin-antitoxin system RelE/ParE family toxin [bacterium]
MTYTLHFLPEVEEDVIAGYAWYEEKAPGLSEEFLRMFYACAGEISQNPLLYPKVYGEYRRSLLRGFPYAIYYYSDRLYLTLVRNFAMFNAWILQLYFPVSKSTWDRMLAFSVDWKVGSLPGAM